MKTEKHPKLTLAGAGPGDIELVTLKTIKALQTADVVLYDALVNKELLKYVPVDTLVIYVGKRNKYHTYTQEQINTLIVDLAFTRGHVVRLKGGDPFVFGRGQEEIKYADAFNIETVVLPGLSSSIAVPTSAGIPVTHRGISESFWVITATTKSGKLSKDITLAAQTNATIVILMGVEKLTEIIDIYTKVGRGNESIAIIQNGTLHNQNIALGSIKTIIDIVREKNIKSPAIIVIGEVVKQHADFPVTLSNLNYLLN